MFDHVKFGVSDFAASRAFFLKALEPIGLAVVAEGSYGVELSPKGKASLCLYPTGENERWTACRQFERSCGTPGHFPRRTGRFRQG